MPRDATRTRERLIRAGERRFAKDGVAGARIRDIVRDAGQANDSAVGYHFGSRDGLLSAIVERHVAVMERLRTEPGEAAGLDTVLRLIVEPTAGLLRTEEGRDFLQIIEQIAGWSGLERGRTSPALQGTVLASLLRRLEHLLSQDLGRALARRRTAALATFLTASLAERARQVQRRGRLRVGHERYVEDLLTMLAAALQAQP
jgi:AcrR family transcriptional regulator